MKHAPIMCVGIVAVMLALTPGVEYAQPALIRLSRAEAVRIALEASPRIGLTRSDSAAAAAAVQLARQFENPNLNASYSKSAPQAHFALEVPFDWPGVRRARVAASENSVGATNLRRANERAALAMDVDTAYSRSSAWIERSALSGHTARDADSLLTIARVRRDAGDASDLDVELASVFAGQSRNAALSDSMSAFASVQALQGLMGLRGDSVFVVLSDRIDPTIDTARSSSAANASALFTTATTSLSVSAAERDRDAATSRVLLEQRRRILAPSLSVGVEAFDPGNSTGPLPTIGFTLPLPLFNRNSASIQVARAELNRANVGVLNARLERAQAYTTAIQASRSANARSARSAQLVESANRVAALSLIAYREGASPLSTAIDAQRTAREALSQYIDDMTAARIAERVLQFLSLTSTVPPQ